jgi:hypothetical protein
MPSSPFSAVRFADELSQKMGFFRVFRGNGWRNFSAVKTCVAERVGFEPTLPFRVNTLSKRAPSATRPSLRRKNLGRTTTRRLRRNARPSRRFSKAIVSLQVGMNFTPTRAHFILWAGEHERKSAKDKRCWSREHHRDKQSPGKQLRGKQLRSRGYNVKRVSPE